MVVSYVASYLDGGYVACVLGGSRLMAHGNAKFDTFEEWIQFGKAQRFDMTKSRVVKCDMVAWSGDDVVGRWDNRNKQGYYSL